MFSAFREWAVWLRSERLSGQWRAQTLGLRLVAGYAALFLASVALLAGLAYVLFVYFLRAPDREFMQEEAHALATAYERGSADALKQRLRHPDPEEQREELLVRVVDAQGRPLLLSNPDNWQRSEIRRLAQQPAPAARATWIELGTAADEDAIEAYAVRLDGGGVLQVGMDADQRTDALESIRSVFLAVALPVLLLALLGGAALAYRALRPLRRLTETFHTVIETGDVGARVPSGDEKGTFADLVGLFNRMLARIEALLGRTRGTLDDVAHDLRTPMTHLRGQAELALQEPRSEAEYREALAGVVEASDEVLTMLDNAIKYTPAGGHVTLSAEPRADAVLIRVRDDGVGIAAENQSHIWDRLYRGDRSRSEHGLGLGLSLVKAIAEAHGGTARVESAPGEGATFTVRLPRSGE